MVPIRSLFLFGAGFIFFVMLDLLWLGFLMRATYQEALGRMMSSHVHWPAALTVWALIVAGSIIFVQPLATNLHEAFLYGALYGFVLYGVYDLTNFALLAAWPLSITVIDIAWGTFVNGVLSGFLWVMQGHIQ